ncbi:MAG: Fe-S cluster assembly protein SufD [Bacteroidales bacterium]|nr:Fe-S cluster assembly protein SufD [Bacteroidales bacterium]
MTNSKTDIQTTTSRKKEAVVLEQPYIELYEQNEETIHIHSASALNHGRRKAFEKFKELGFPTPRVEIYKYTDLREPLGVDYGLNIKRMNFPVNPYNVFKCDVPGISAYLYFVVNDAFYPMENRKSHPLPEGVIIISLRKASEDYPELVEKYISKLAEKHVDGMIAFNGAFAQDGFFIYVPKNVVLDRPIQIVNIMRSDVDFMANSHNLVIVEQGAKAQVLVCDHTVDDVRFFSNRVTEVFVGENAFYEHYKLENVSRKTTEVSTLLIAQEQNSNVLGNILTLHNGITRNNIEIDLDGENCETYLTGMTLSDGRQVVDNYTSILHNQPNSHSNEKFKYILDEESKGGFTGRLFVAKDAQKTLAYQNNKNILLNHTAKMRTKPQLEIYADDVKCSHGATIGQLDEKAMFYMRQRGISEKEARMLLMYAFTADVIDNIRIDALKDRIKILVEKRLRGELSKCEGCSIC